MMDTDVGTTEKDDAAEVAKNGFDAMMKGQGDVVSGFKNKIQSAAANVTPVCTGNLNPDVVVVKSAEDRA